ncbi:unnamed protein product [marine sediment metagenome]|uniref:Uncharacterized protein n=1 Tax=marine sediment metagenome TaxID=412755 RepID=X1RIH2_9ZZZZ
MQVKKAHLTKPYFLKRIWNQLLGIHFREKDNVIDLLKEESIESKIKISNILAEHEKERDLEEQYELTEEELAELERNYTLNDLENKIEELRKKSYPRRLKEWEKENE